MVSHETIFGRRKEANPVTEVCFQNLKKIISKLLMMEFFLNKVANPQPDIF